MSRLSGAGAYSHAGTAGSEGAAREVLWMSVIGALPSPSVDGEVVRALVGAGSFLVDLHEHVVEERGGSQAEPIRRHPVGAQRLVQQDQVLDGLLRLPDPAGHL